MSYLDLYQSSILQEGTADAIHSDDEESITVAPINPVQAHYRNYHLTSILAEEIVGALSTTQAIDMAYNAIDQLPRKTSPMLIALDVSYNIIERPIIMNAGYQLIELNMSNNRIVDLKGIALLDTLEFLDVSSNLLSRLEGLENMKRLKVLKLQHNKISTFQSLRLLTYNVCLSDVRLEGNTIVDDPYFKVKLINYIPNLKYLDGTTVWRRTSLQSRVVNDDLQYSDLCARTPASVQKYAKLSKRSGSLHNLYDMHDLTSSMLTMQGLRNFNNHNQQTNLATPMRPYNRPLPEQTPLPSGLTYLGVTDTPASGKHSFNSPERSLFRAPSAGAATGDANSDIDLLPVHLQAILRKHVRAYASPRRSVHPLNSTGSGVANNSPVKKGNVVTRTVSSQENKPEATPRSRSALPWRNPPTLAPNLEIGFKSRRSGDSDSVSVATPGVEASKSGTNGHGGGRANSVTRACQRMFNAAVSVSATPQAQQVQKPLTKPASSSSLRAPMATPQSLSTPRSASPVRASPPRTASADTTASRAPDASSNITSAESGQWMNPDLNSAIKARVSVPFDNNLNQMESAMNSSLFVLQKSFDADHKRVRSDNGSVASSSAQQRGRTRARQDNLQLGGTSDSGARSVSSSVNLRSVTPTKASIIRANFTSELIRATQVTESQARELRENCTYSRPSSPSHSPHRQRNPAYTYLQGTSSPTKPREELEGIPSYSVRTQPFSPQSTPRGKSASPSRKARSTSPPRVSSTARILDVYKEMPHESENDSRHVSYSKQRSSSKVPHYATSRHRQYSPVSYTDPSNESHGHGENHHLHIKVPHGGSKQVPASAHAHGPTHIRVTKGNRVASPSRRSRSPSRKHRIPRTYCEESKSRDQWEGAPPPPPPNVGDDSPYRRFLQLRERLSSKYVQSAAENSEFFEPVRSSSSDKHDEPKILVENDRSKDRSNGLPIESVRSESLPRDIRHYSDGFVEMKGQEYPESQTGHVLSVAQPVAQVLNTQNLQENLPPPPPPQELSFEQLKEQYQRQYQIEYEKQRQEQENIHARVGSSATPEAPPVPTPLTQSAALSRSIDLPAGSIVAPPTVPPRSAGYEALFDLIHQRRSVLERITQPRDLSPDKARHASPGKDRIGGAISHLKHRQEASVNVIQSVTRERTVPVPVHNGLMQVSLSTPALHASINNYASMAQTPHQADSVQNALGMMHNSFLNRLTSNNPYMTPADNRHAVAISGGASSPPALSASTTAVSVPVVGARFQGVTNLMGSYPAPPPFVPQGPPSPPASTVALVEKSVHMPRVGSAENSAFPVSAPAVPVESIMPASGRLAQAIRDLQAKQTRDISALKKQ